ncbi:hypothetical protein PFISCL1PPCAC_1368 [Pristionchus fissidentatus]|uniref:Major facilitator superfamily (MFS) profile domain-containing protein n=1 Tax=Pristionchus fissidentatus TaxID=1538716 RepID=A0AAV5UU93_9BILA|nr:hypothetical protein PFISCL1PPCAC_1368 [Pristionchus fissidentatus]
MQRPSFAICILSLALCVTGGFQQGYIASVLNPPYVYIEAFINETVTERFGVVMSDDVMSTVWSFLNVMFPVASIVGQFVAAWMCKRFGRRGTAIITCLLYLPGTIMSSLAYPARSFEMIFIGRFLWSLGNGINAVNATVWIVECAPISIRGAMGAMQEFSMAIGSLVCQSLGVPFSNETMWPWIFAPNAPLCLLSIGLFMMIPDSPVSILEREGDVEKARAALAKYYGVSPDAPEIDKEFEVEKKKGGGEEGEKQSEEKPGILWIFNPFGRKEDKMRVIQQAAWLGVMVKIAYVFTGARALRAYSTFVLFELSHFTLEGANFGSWIISILRIPFTLIPVIFVDRLGRRLLMNWSMIITVASLVLMMVSILVGDAMQIPSAIGFAALLLINAAGLGSVSRFYAAELVPRSLLLNAVSILAGIEAFTKIVVEFAFFPVANVIGVWSFLMFLIPSLIFLVVIWIMCPETSNRTVHQVLDDIALRKNLKVKFTQ